MADEATDVQEPEITPEDFTADEQESTKAEPSPAKEAKESKPKAEKKPEVVAEESKDKVEADDTADESKKPEVNETETEAEGVETETKPQNKADERKAQLNTEIRDLVAQRNTLKQEVEKQTAEVYQSASEQELIDEGMSATDAKVEALRQQIEVRDYNERVADAQLTIESESNRVLNDFPMFNPDSDQFDNELAEEAADLLRANLVTNPDTGQIIGTNVSPYRLYQTIARASGLSAAKGQIKGQQATETMLANADSASSASPPKKQADPLADLWSDPL